MKHTKTNVKPKTTNTNTKTFDLKKLAIDLDKIHDINELINFYQKQQKNNPSWNFNYYLQIFKLVAQNLNDNDYEAAIKNLQEELEAPYVSQDIEIYLNAIQKLVRNAAYEKNNSEIVKMDRKQLIALALEDFPKNLQIFDYFTSKASNFFRTEDLDYFRFIFTSKEFKNSLKSSTLFFLNEVSDFFDLTLQVKNVHTNKDYQIILGKNIISDKVEKFYNKTFSEISKLISKDPSLEEIANSLVDQIAIYYFPDHPDCDPTLLGKKIVEYIYLSLNNNQGFRDQSKQNNDEVTLLIQTVLKAAE